MIGELLFQGDDSKMGEDVNILFPQPLLILPRLPVSLWRFCPHSTEICTTFQQQSGIPPHNPARKKKPGFKGPGLFISAKTKQSSDLSDGYPLTQQNSATPIPFLPAFSRKNKAFS
jgi:hypothetical protein